MRLIYSRARHVLTVIPDAGPTSQWPARNNVARRGRGPWPAGSYHADALVRVEGREGEPGGSYGRWFLRFTVPDRDGIDDALDLGADGLPDAADGPGIGMGIHAGRQDVSDGLGRTGVHHATLGCIRTLGAAMEAIAAAWEHDRAARLTVE